MSTWTLPSSKEDGEHIWWWGKSPSMGWNFLSRIFTVLTIHLFDRQPPKYRFCQRIIGPTSSFMKQNFVAINARTRKEKIWARDISGFATCAYSIKSEHLYFLGMLSESKRGHRELLAVSRTLEYYDRTKVSTTKPTTITGSQTAKIWPLSWQRDLERDTFKVKCFGLWICAKD